MSTMKLDDLAQYVPARFMTKLCVAPSGCWEWTAARHGKGYGHFRVDSKVWKAHRYIWYKIHSTPPSGLHVLHRCDNPPCCNPTHLFLGTNADNVSDRDAKGRQAVGDRNGKQKLTPDQVREIRWQYSRCEVTQKELACRYGVDSSWISRLVNHKFRKVLP